MSVFCKNHTCLCANAPTHISILYIPGKKKYKGMWTKPMPEFGNLLQRGRSLRMGAGQVGVEQFPGAPGN